jgi:hypothetical protein
MTWWDSIEEYLATREAADGDAPDPWAAVELAEPSLTDEQIAYLGFDQPAVPRLGGLGGSGDATGNSPGDG